MQHPYWHAARTPDRIAYQMAGSGETVSYRQLEERSNQVAHLLRARGLKAGDRIALMMENHPRYFEICWGAQRSGLVYTAISSRLTAAEVGIAGCARIAICRSTSAVTYSTVFCRAAETRGCILSVRPSSGKSATDALPV